jgi:hypothetical protein
MILKSVLKVIGLWPRVYPKNTCLPSLRRRLKHPQPYELKGDLKVK